MKSCLVVFLLFFGFLFLGGTVVYQLSVNDSLTIEPRESEEFYINTKRSYRPPAKRQVETDETELQEGQEAPIMP